MRKLRFISKIIVPILISVSSFFELHSQNFEYILVGNQVWMQGNLNVSTFRNGDSILEAKTKDEWQLAGKNKIPAWCFYSNEEGIGNNCGRLYNWFALTDKRGLAPRGWDLPNNNDWLEFSKLQLTSKELSCMGFRSFPCGVREKDDRDDPDPSLFTGLGYFTLYWSLSNGSKSDEEKYGQDVFQAYFFNPANNSLKNTYQSHENLKPFGFYVKCIKK